MSNAGSCQETQGLLQVLVEGGLNATERTAVEAHVAICPACTAEGARLQENASFLQEALGPFRMPADLTPEFLLALPRKDQKRKPPAPAAAEPRSFVLGDTRARRTSPWKWIGGLVFLGAAGGLAWLFLNDREDPGRRGPRNQPAIGPRDPRGDGPADPKKPGKPVPKPVPGGGTDKKPVIPAPSAGPIRTAAELAAALRAVQGETSTPVVRKGWDLLAGSPAEAKATRDLAAGEKEARVRAGLVLCLGADGTEDNRSALRGFLSDPAPEVRGAAALGLGRSLSIDDQRPSIIPSGPPLGTPVDVGVMIEDPGRAELASRLSAESDPGVRRILIAVLGPTAPADAALRDRLLDGVKGAYGDDLREASVKALQGVKDPILVEVFYEALANPNTPKSLHGVLLAAMTAADEKAAAEKLGELLSKAEGPELRREILAALGRVGGPAAQKAFTDALGGDSDAAVRLVAAASLQRYPSKEVLEVLQRAADNDADQGVRSEADRVAKAMKAALEKAEGGGQETPPGDNPPPVPAGGGN